MFTLTERLASPGATKFQTRYNNVKGRTECLFEVFFTRLPGRKMARIAKSIRAAIDRFLRTPPEYKPFSNIFDQANKLLEHL